MPHAANYTAKAAADLQAEIDYYTELHEAQYGHLDRPIGDKAEWAHDYLLAEYNRATLLGIPDCLKGRRYLMSMRTGMSTAEIGGIFGRLKREAKGEPAQKQKTPEQVAILENFLEEIQPYPSRVDIQDLVIATGGLTRKQITAWFEHQRKKRGITEYADDYDARDESNNSRDPVWSNHPGCTWKLWDQWFESVLAGEADLTYESYVASVGDLVEGRRY